MKARGMKDDDYQNAIDYFANEIVKRLNISRTMDRENQRIPDD